MMNKKILLTILKLLVSYPAKALLYIIQLADSKNGLLSKGRKCFSYDQKHILLEILLNSQNLSF